MLSWRLLKKVTLDIPLTEEAAQLQESSSLSAKNRYGFWIDPIMKDLKAVVVGITSEQISRTLDRDAAQVLKRVPG